MDVEYLIGSVLRSVLTGRSHRKNVGGAMRYLVGNPASAGKGALLVGGLAYALFESLTQSGGFGTTAAPAVPPVPGAPPAGASAAAGRTVPPPLPSGVRTSASTPPPLPVTGTPVPAAPPQAGAAASTLAEVSPDVLRVVRLSISAASADGQLSEREREAILAKARAAGVEALIADDLRQPRNVREILSGVTDGSHRQQLYSIAFAIVRADEDVTDAERAYLRQVADALELSTPDVETLEQQAAARISKAAQERDAQ